MKTRLTSEHWLFKKPIAHRGLHDEYVVENCPTAFRKAIEKGFPIETDVQMSDDGVLFCYHDDDMKRVARLLADIRDVQSKTIKSLTIGENEKIPTFKEFLALVDGKVPLLIEVKRQKKKGIEQKILDELKGYNGEYVIQSFDPFILKNFKKLAPARLRYALLCAHTESPPNEITSEARESESASTPLSASFLQPKVHSIIPVKSPSALSEPKTGVKILTSG